LIRIGAYQKGVDKDLDEAINKKEAMENFLRQNPNEIYSFEKIVKMLNTIV